MEVLVSVAILAVLMLAMMQSQLSMTYITARTGKIGLLESHVNNELLKDERNLDQIVISKSEGDFPEDHILYGYSWEKEVADEKLYELINVRRVSYRITWEERGEKRIFESFLLLDPGLNKDLQLDEVFGEL